MFYKKKNIFFIVIMFTFFFLVSNYYFSENNVIYTNKSRSNYINNSTNDINNLPILKNNTYDSIYYINDLDNFKKKRKKRFWESLISNFNE